jgi:hypothetical protein
MREGPKLEVASTVPYSMIDESTVNPALRCILTSRTMSSCSALTGNQCRVQGCIRLQKGRQRRVTRRVGRRKEARLA